MTGINRTGCGCSWRELDKKAQYRRLWRGEG